MPKRTLNEVHTAVEAGPPHAPAPVTARCCASRSGARRRHSARPQAAQWREELQAGIGPLAGPLVAAAVVLGHPLPGLNDSKQLTPEKRAHLFDVLRDGPHAIGIAVVPSGEIDRMGIQPANYAAMHRAVNQITPLPDYLLVDGFEIAGCPIPQCRIIKGDCRSQSIAAASIIAKVTRDRIMDELDGQFPQYGFARHKGYGTSEHLEAIARCGPCPHHRRSFAPFARSLQTGPLFSEPDEDSCSCAT